jgi:hypothetical protein
VAIGSPPATWASAAWRWPRPLASASDRPRLLSTGFFAFEQGEWEEALRRLQRQRYRQEGGLELLQERILGNMGIVHVLAARRRAIALYGRASPP